jgi:hypothetical protein
MQRAGSAALGAAVDTARSGAHGVANRLDRSAASSTASARTAAGGLATTAGTATNTAKGAVKTTASTATDAAKGAVTMVTDTVAKSLPTGVGVAFALVVRKVTLLLRFLRQLALQLLEALNQLAGRLREAAARRRSGEQGALDGKAAEDRVDRREPATRPAQRPQPEGQRPQRPARPRRDVNAPQPDAPAAAVRRAPGARQPERPGRRVPGAVARSE